ncbi:uncharacterized protein BXZ73DRAFT_101063 [Epithele typhae]|uniref:uncharacterized protein n=1 Tax=Epithele typhae TaxID=378194 RepID=UPI0020072B07|nr:uncharacterized protein BXZ73DRAFT_101063 [Epithele typhae]KAH9933678.1 hypothetical protein BXZ73DRAFT_101063 [Epithele typhae]
MGMTEDNEEQELNSFRQPSTTLHPTPPSSPASAPAIPDELTDRLNSLAKQLEMAPELARLLEAQHATTQSTISVLESKTQHSPSPTISASTFVARTKWGNTLARNSTAPVPNIAATSGPGPIVQPFFAFLSAMRKRKLALRKPTSGAWRASVASSAIPADLEATKQLVQASESARAAPQEPTVPVAAVEEARKEERELLTSMFVEWKKNVEGKWSSVHKDWTEEREHLRQARDEWESRMRAAEETVSIAATEVENGQMSLASFQAQPQQKYMDDNAKPQSSGSLVTPPSPRSLSAESTRPRNRRKHAGSLEAMAHPRCVGWGEMGLNYHYDNSPRALQHEAFNRQYALPRRRALPRAHSALVGIVGGVVVYTV